MRQKDEESEADGTVDVQDDRSRSRTPMRSCSPAASKTVIEAAMARKNDVNDTSRSFSKNSRAAQKQRSRGQTSPRRALPVEKEAKENKLRSAGFSTKRKDEPSDSCLDFSVADLSEHQKKSLGGEEEEMEIDNRSSKFSIRNPSLDLTCSETMSLDIETLSASPDSLEDAPLFPSNEKIEEEVRSTKDALLNQLDTNEDKIRFLSQDSKETVPVAGNVSLDFESLEENEIDSRSPLNDTSCTPANYSDMDSLSCEIACLDASTTSNKVMASAKKKLCDKKDSGDARRRCEAKAVLESVITDVEERVFNVNYGVS